VKKGKNEEYFFVGLIFMRFFYYICRPETTIVQRAVCMAFVRSTSGNLINVLPVFH